MQHTHYTPISRDAAGNIERIGPKSKLGLANIPESGGAVATARIVSVEPDQIAGWGDATAIGSVEVLIDGRQSGQAPILALLY